MNLSEAEQDFEINVKEILFSGHVFHKVRSKRPQRSWRGVGSRGRYAWVELCARSSGDQPAEDPASVVQ